MKKQFLFAVAVTMLTACVNTENLSDVDINAYAGNEIEFAPFANKQTRGQAENSNANTKQSNLEVHQKSFNVWGYKTSNDATPVVTRVFNKQDVTYNASSTTFATKWEYNPLIFWDKGANHYDFYAATPATLSWIMDDGDTDEGNTHTLSLASHEVDGASLNILDANLPSSPTTGDAATWLKDLGSGNYENKDIMISIDNGVTNYKTYSSTAVNFEFMHILSRLNIAVKIDDILATDLNNDTKLDYTVTLKSIKVFNLKKNGKFNEANASAPSLSSGTTARWQDLNYDLCKRFKGGIGFESTAGVQLTTTEKYFYQTLIIPQNVNYQLISIDGKAHSGEEYFGVEEYNFVNGGTPLTPAQYAALPDKTKPATAALIPYTHDYDGASYSTTSGYYDGSSAPYLEICYTITPTYGTNANVTETFTQYYNLAAAFGKNESTKVNTGTTEAPVYVNQYAFNEGWMHNLIIKIDPVAINFDAEVIEWGTKNEFNTETEIN